MHQRLNKFLVQGRCFYNLQFGFRVNCSTKYARMSIIENTQTHLDDGKYGAGSFLTSKRLLIQLIMIYS